MFVYLIIYLCILAYGVWYAIDPTRSLKRKYGEQDIPPLTIKTARIIGIFFIVVGLAGAIYSTVRLLQGA